MRHVRTMTPKEVRIAADRAELRPRKVDFLPLAVRLAADRAEASVFLKAAAEAVRKASADDDAIPF